MENEIWLPINKDELKNTYEVSNTGKIRNIKNNNKILGKCLQNNYEYVSIYNEKKQKLFLVHRLVALLFIENNDPINKTIVNHKDGNKTNNNKNNLEWMTCSENTKHAVKNGLLKSFEREVVQYSLDGKFINKFKSIKVASEKTNIGKRNIGKVCKVQRKTAGGYLWKYSIENPNEIIVDLTKNNCKNISYYQNYYIFNNGKIYSKSAKKYLKPFSDGSGYLCIGLTKNNIKKSFRIHRLVAEFFIKNSDPENKIVVNHKDGNKQNNKKNNLEWVTSSENTKHYYAVLKPNNK